MRVELIELEQAPVAELEAMQTSVASTLLYTSYAYLKMLKGFLSCDIELVLLYDEQNCVKGFLPIAYKKGSAGVVANSLPFYGSNGSMIITDDVQDKEAALSLMFQKAIESISSKSCIAATFISNPLDPNTDRWLNEHAGHQLIDERIGQISHLPAKSTTLAEDLIKNFEDPRPRNIRKAIKEGIKVYYAHDQEALTFLYQVHYDNITAINGIPKEKRFFTSIPDYFVEKDYRVYIAEYQGQKIGALLLFYYNQTVEYFTPAVIENFRNIQPTALLIYQAMLDAVDDGYRNWNWGGTWLSQGGVYDFKKKWGTTDYRYFYYTLLTDETLLEKSRQFLLEEYPYFFVVPFSKLKS